MDHKERNKRLKQFIHGWSGEQPDTFLVTHPPNLNYLFGFTGSLGSAVITADQTILLVDSRYQEQAELETSGCSVRLSKDPLSEGLKNLLTELAPEKRITVEAGQLSYESALRIQGWDFEVFPTYYLIKKQRAIKSPTEIEILKKASELAGIAFDRFVIQLPWEKTETQAAGLLEYECRIAGSQGPSFETIVASGNQTSLPHAKTGSKILSPVENLLIDFGIRYAFYCSDSTRMIIPENQTEILKIFQIVEKAQENAISIVKPGITARDVDSAARNVIRDFGYGDYFGHGTGHGLGLEVHEYPHISPRSSDILEAGMVFTIEPGIYLPGKFGIRLEDTVLVTESGPDIISRSKI